ncbi:MAG: sensor histidine kinase [Flavobacteriales bacterium]
MLQKPKPTFWLYFLGAYVVLQFAWWGYHLIQLSAYIPQEDAKLAKRIGMVFGEGAVFLLILIFGIYRIRKSISKEFELQKRQNNFLLTVTHELKTPLAALKLYLQTLQKHSLTDEKKEQIIDGALSENERLVQLIENILNTSRAENKAFELRKEKLQLLDFFNALTERYQKRYKELRLDIQIADHLNLVADPQMLETIFSNLLDNAIKYGGAQQKISIQAIGLDRFVNITVTDEGPGIAAHERSHIFEKFYRIGNEDTRKAAGSGLGLYLVSELVHLHNGQVRCQENHPKGCVFEVILPYE